MNEFWPQAETSDMKLAATKSVLIAVRVHPFPSRTRQLSSPAPKILGWRRPGKIGSANTHEGDTSYEVSPFVLVLYLGREDIPQQCLLNRAACNRSGCNLARS